MGTTSALGYMWPARSAHSGLAGAPDLADVRLDALLLDDPPELLLPDPDPPEDDPPEDELLEDELPDPELPDGELPELPEDVLPDEDDPESPDFAGEVADSFAAVLPESAEAAESDFSVLLTAPTAPARESVR